MRSVNPTNDLAFRKVFGSSENIHILAGLIKDFFFIEPTGLAIENPYSIKSYKELLKDQEVFRLRQTISDIAATMQWADYRSELQVRKDNFYDERSLYYPLNRFVSRYRVVPGDDSAYARLRPIYALNILGYKHFPDDEDALRIFKLYDPVRNKVYRKDLLNLGYFELLKTNVETDNQRDWQNYFLQKSLSAMAPDYIREALHIIDLSNMEEEELAVVEQIDYYRSIYDGQLAYAKDEGKIEMILEMLRDNVPIDTIMKYSGFTKKQIDELKPV